LAQQPHPKEKKERVRSIGCLWFFVVLLLAAVGLCAAAVYVLHREFVRVYGDLDEKTVAVCDRLTGIEQELKSAQKERHSLSTDFKELKLKQDALQKEGEGLVQSWREIKEATLAYQKSLQTIVDEIRRQKEIGKAMETAPTGKKVDVIEAKK